MSRHRSLVVAFALGAAIGALGGFVHEVWPPPVTIVLFLLSPGSFVSAPIAPFVLFGDLQTAQFTIATLVAVANGFIFATVALLFRVGREAGSPVVRRSALACAVASITAWIAFSAFQVVGSLAESRPPAFATDSPLTGRWEGDYRNQRIEMNAALICRPRVDGTLDGVLWIGGRREGDLYAGTYRGDSLGFIAGRELYRARRDGNRMTVEHLVRGQTFGVIELHFVGPDIRDD
jgi:hypothetical protein